MNFDPKRRVRPTRLLNAAARLGTLLIVVGAVGCRSPAHQVESFATAHGFEREVVEGKPFRHVVLRNQLPPRHSTLRVYIEGDGTPFLKASTVALDPTPLQPLMLHLMALDPQGAVYVGRPCYLGLRVDRPCEPLDWTLRRFSPAIVASMAVVIDSEMRRAGATSVQLFGHSGGAALAVLLAHELPVEALVTIGGNLDTDAWVRLHGYTPLLGSLNPVATALSPTLALRTGHWVGANDTSVPASLVRTASARIGGTVHEIPGYSHQCCWEQLWPAILLSESRY